MSVGFTFQPLSQLVNFSGSKLSVERFRYPFNVTADPTAESAIAGDGSTLANAGFVLVWRYAFI